MRSFETFFIHVLLLHFKKCSRDRLARRTTRQTNANGDRFLGKPTRIDRIVIVVDNILFTVIVVNAFIVIVAVIVILIMTILLVIVGLVVRILKYKKNILSILSLKQAVTKQNSFVRRYLFEPHLYERHLLT